MTAFAPSVAPPAHREVSAVSPVSSPPQQNVWPVDDERLAVFSPYPPYGVFTLSDPKEKTAWTSFVPGLRPGDVVTFLYSIYNTGSQQTRHLNVELASLYSPTDATINGVITAANAQSTAATVRMAWLPCYTHIHLEYRNAFLYTWEQPGKYIKTTTSINAAALLTKKLSLPEVMPGNGEFLTVEYAITGDRIEPCNPVAAS